MIQSNGAIPYPSVLKEDGKKFFFSEIKELVFFKDIEVMEERYNDEDISETIYSCKIILKDGGSTKIRSLISWEGRNKKNQPNLYRAFIILLLEKLNLYNPEFYVSSGILSRVNKAIPVLKIGGLSIASASIFSIIDNNLIEMGEYASFFFNAPYAGILGMLGVGSFFLSTKFIIAKLKKQTTLEYIQKEYLPQ